MGVILAKFRKEKTTYQLLERLEEKIKSIEEFSISTQQRQKRFVGNFLVISIGLYVLAFAVFYFVFFPPTWVQRVAYITPMLIFPFVILFLKRLFAWYYERKLSKNSTQLNGLRAEKRKIIEKVMDKETYKVAIDILQRFGDSSTTPSSGHHQHAGNAFSLTTGHSSNGQSRHQQQQQHHHHHHHHPSTNSHHHSPKPPNTQIPLPTATPYRALATNTSATTSNTSSLTPRAPLARQLLTPSAGALALRTPNKPTPYNQSSSPAPNTQLQLRTPQMSGTQQQMQRLQVPGATGYRGGSAQLLQQQQMQQYQATPFPIINFNAKGYMEKLVDFLIGEGISSRYGMICKECLQHNGMATLEEYEYSAFRCAFCKTLNPARKLRPISPRIPGSTEDLAQELKQDSSDTSSGSDSEATVDVGSKMPAAESSSDAEKSSGEKKND